MTKEIKKNELEYATGDYLDDRLEKIEKNFDEKLDKKFNEQTRIILESMDFMLTKHISEIKEDLRIKINCIQNSFDRYTKNR